MNTSRYEGKRLSFGIDPKFMTAPITNLPSDTVKVRRRMRGNDFPKAYVKTADGCIAGYILEDDGPSAMKLEAFPSLGVNQSKIVNRKSEIPPALLRGGRRDRVEGAGANSRQLPDAPDANLNQTK